jgi:hypothetical protein
MENSFEFQVLLIGLNLHGRSFFMQDLMTFLGDFLLKSLEIGKFLEFINFLGCWEISWKINILLKICRIFG